MNWKPYMHSAPHADGEGTVILDEDYRDLCRITVEQLADGSYTITCGVYGLLVHTVHAAGDEELAYILPQLENELAGYADSGVCDDEDATEDWCIAFTQSWQ